MSGEALNTDRELWRERQGDYYADSIHVTQSGAIGINCGGIVIVMPIRKWHDAIREIERLEVEVSRLCYWLLETYRTLTRDASMDDGMTDDELAKAIVDVLANREIDPNTVAGSKHLGIWEVKDSRERY